MQTLAKHFPTIRRYYYRGVSAVKIGLVAIVIIGGAGLLGYYGSALF